MRRKFLVSGLAVVALTSGGHADRGGLAGVRQLRGHDQRCL